MAESFGGIHTRWINVDHSSNFSHDFFCNIKDIINQINFNNNSQQQEQTVLMLESIKSTNDFLDFLTDIFLALGELAKDFGSYICFFIEDMHCLKKEEAQALTMAIHRSNQRRLPIMIFGAGSPSVIRLFGNSCPYAERLFIYSAVSSQITSKAE